MHLEHDKEEVILEEVKSAGGRIMNLSEPYTAEDFERYLKNADKLMLLEQRLFAKYVPRLYELARSEIAAGSKDNPAFVHTSVETFIRLSHRFHVYVGSTISEEQLNDKFGALSGTFGPAVTATMLEEIDADVLAFAREADRETVEQIKDRLVAEREEQRQKLEGLLGKAQE